MEKKSIFLEGSLEKEQNEMQILREKILKYHKLFEIENIPRESKLA